LALASQRSDSLFMETSLATRLLLATIILEQYKRQKPANAGF
jgi:hypothetical protein